MFGIIAAKKAGVNYHSTNDSRQAEANDAPVKTGRPPASRFPPVHPLTLVCVLAFDKNRRAIFKQLFFRRKEFVVGDKHSAADFLGSQVHKFSKVHSHTSPQDKKQKLCSRF